MSSTRIVISVAAGALASAAAWLALRGEPDVPRMSVWNAAVTSAASPGRAASRRAGAVPSLPDPPATAARAATLADLEHALADADPGARDRVLARLLPPLVARDPDVVARFAELQSDPRLRELLLRDVARYWAEHDATAAARWAAALPDAYERDAATTDIALALATRDPAGAVALRESHVSGVRDAGALPDNTLVNLAQQWATQDFTAALAWTNAQPAGPQRDQVLQRLVFVRAEEGELAAAAELAATISSDKARDTALAAVAQQWLLRDPEGARAWSRSLAGATRARVDEELAVMDGGAG